jgi:hypothetical protein
MYEALCLIPSTRKRERERGVREGREGGEGKKGRKEGEKGS